MITFDGMIFSSRNRSGGVSVYFRELIRRAALLEQEISVIVHDPRITASDVAANPGQLVFRPARMLERYRPLRGLEPGLLHSSYYRTSGQAGVQNVVTVYDFTYEKFTSGVRRLVHTRQKCAAIRRADAVLCISGNTRRDLLELLPDYPPERVFVTYLAASESFTPLKSSDAEPARRPFVLFVSGRSTYKNFSAAVRAVSCVPGFALICVGGGEFTAEERAMLERFLPGRYSHSGRVDVAGLNMLYNQAVCLLYPSLYEGFGIPLLEAMRAGCPFVALNASSIPEVAGEAGILLDDPAVEALAAAVRQCAEPSQRARLRESGFAQARGFSWDRTAAETFAVYRMLQEAM